MNIIASLIATDPDTAESVVEDLSELFRASLNDAGNQVKLEEELDLCERYVRIEAAAFVDGPTGPDNAGFDLDALAAVHAVPGADDDANGIPVALE